MNNTINFNGAIKLTPIVEKTIREREFFTLQKIFKNLPEDVFVNNRKVFNETQDLRETFFECYSDKTKQILSQIVSIPKNF